MPGLDAWNEQLLINDKSSVNGNTRFAQEYSKEIRDVISRYAVRLPRTLQRHLGPSELGHGCDAQLIGKMAGVSFGHSSGSALHDPWASLMGTWGHAGMEEALGWDAADPDPGKSDLENGKNPGRWFTERRVTPDPKAKQPHPGTADLYDAKYKLLGDYKFQSEGVRAKLKRNGPPPHYYWQMLLYALGYINEGFEVERVMLISMPRTASSMDDIYCWEHTITPEDWQGVQDLLKKTEIREQLAELVVKGELAWEDIPVTPSESDCQYCGFFNPRKAVDPKAWGCAGMELIRKS